ncbi:hypothetical protein [Thermotoga sp. KOL6]|uniref:hypothetical protein n=1 Tax=Thermotoga sp. KOL6 TaxID=126741 RepID=UPI000CC1F6DA|nr:hypothetical protein [Thermotoga sp. KOL6]PLV58697.1 hypothetical protein AS005_07365 [Thermotoga sp. KOL6]
MELIFEGRPSKSFCFSMVFNIGWRHEPQNMRGSVLEMLEKLSESVREEIPSYFEVSRSVDAEFSEIRVWGTSDEADFLLKVIQMVFSFPHSVFLELGGGPLFTVAVGAIRSEILREIEKMKAPTPSKVPKLHIKPRNFLKVFELTRLEEFFLYHFLKDSNQEVYLELSPFGDRIHYGKFFRLPLFSEVSGYKNKFKAIIAKKIETTEGAVDFLVKLNIFKRSKVLIKDTFEDLENINLLRRLDVIEKMFRRFRG